jgi:site-specific DNA recombinase
LGVTPFGGGAVRPEKRVTAKSKLAQEGWRAIPGHYDDGAFSGASLERPALQQLLADVQAGTIDIVLVYKVDRLTRSLADFAKLIEPFDAKLLAA